LNKLSEDTVCILPFMHMHTWPSGEVFICCEGVSGSEPIG